MVVNLACPVRAATHELLLSADALGDRLPLLGNFRQGFLGDDLPLRARITCSIEHGVVFATTQELQRRHRHWRLDSVSRQLQIVIRSAGPSSCQ